MKVIALQTFSEHFITKGNIYDASEDEWVNRTPEKISIEDFKKFSSDLFIAVRDRINTNKAK